MSEGAAKAQKHYQQAEIEPIEIMQMYLSPEEFRGFLLGNVIKYTLRAKFKGLPLVDLEKARQYAAWLQHALEGKKINPREGLE